jgi:glycosyltransferase involved in cell wall biosynthesis
MRLRQVADVFIYEPDRGIYDAMNKGLKMASGHYVYFLNSGDELINMPVVLYHIKASMDEGRKAVLVFRSLQKFGNVAWIRPRESLVRFFAKAGAHQATVVPLDGTRGIEFDRSKPISADSVWIRRCIERVGVKTFCEVVAIFELGGISNAATYACQLAVFRDSPSLGRFLALVVKPLSLFLFGYLSYFRILYSWKYEYVPDVKRYLHDHHPEAAFLA